MASMVARLLGALRGVFGKRDDRWVRPSNTITRWLNGTLEAPAAPPPAVQGEGANPAPTAAEERSSASDAA
ncbi:hypothetical protein HRbin29_00560 [bacterium HR29]|jgi:hypothetical protein|nr:hypothetical protein HRbin29_00560 [bacterium HR29]